MGGKDPVVPNSIQMGPNLGLQNVNATQLAQNNPQLNGIMSSLASGSMSYQDAIKAAQGLQSTSDPYASQRQGLQTQLDQMNAQEYKKFNHDGNFKNVDYSNSPEYQQFMSTKTSLQNQLNSIPTQDALNSQLQSAGMQQLFSDPRTASLIANGQVLDQNAMGKTFKNLDSNMASDRNALMGRDQSYGLNDTDLAAYGQASGNIARQFGQTGNNLAQMLANNGLSNSNGAAAQVYSGAMGNQNEQLAQSQMAIAQNRIATAKDLATQRMNSDLQVGQQYQNALGQQEGLNTGLSQDQFNKSIGASNATLGSYATQQNAANEAAAAQNQSSSSGGGPGAAIGTVLGAAIGGVAGKSPEAAAVGGSVGGSVGSQIGKR